MEGPGLSRRILLRCVSVTGVKNEIDTAEPFVRHTAALVDHVVVLDNGSTDGTLDVLRSLGREGLALRIVEDQAPDRWQWQRLTRLMRDVAAGQQGADWIVPLDGDEFLPDSAPRSLRAALEGASGPRFVPWRTLFTVLDCAESLARLHARSESR